MSSPDSALPKSPNGSSTLEKGILTVQDLPVEVIAHIFSFLDASSLVRASQTCKYWRHLMGSEMVWRHALERHLTRLPPKRCAGTWREEYLDRSQLERVWGYDRLGIRSLRFTIGPINIAYVDPSGEWMVGVNTTTGMAQAGDFRAGKVVKPPIYPDRTLVPRLNPHTLVGSGHIVWGHRDGLLTTTSLDQEGKMAKRAREASIRHHGAISSLVWDVQRPQWVVSGCVTGQVILWSLPNLEPLLHLTGIPQGARIQDLILSHKHHVLALTETHLYLWNMNLSTWARADDPTQVLSRTPTKTILLQPPSTRSFRAIKMVQGNNANDVVLLGEDGASSLWGLDLTTGTFITQYVLPGSLSLSPGGVLVPLPASGSLAYGEGNGVIRVWEMTLTPAPTTSLAMDLTEGHRGQRVSSVVGDAHVLLSAGMDGRICTWDAVSGRLLRTLKAKARRGGDREGGAGVDRGGSAAPQSLHLLPRAILALCGDQAKLWSFDLGGRRRQGWGFSTSSTSRPGSSRGGGLDRKDVAVHLQEGLDHVREEREEAQRASRRRMEVRQRLQGMDLTDLTDEEMVQYVSMLSMETKGAAVGEGEAQEEQVGEGDEAREARDLEFAIQLSMAESNGSKWEDEDAD
ncbi:hypothetical protein BJ684DRAFT_19159 [Piptocephalis cylindrospora]|uniref:F-box domain-containing protein n=1 Tax=Piptocephalis cylindrospora TaxID=1907219 RepID=A0A4P9Y5W2_9FUNG|nr:hypothetical protein BJ684DRAFT_19159 [Piptocephalis cylindrospora]|eukprot:RKP14438.1 hypothetical protein BJ684DRAFT_19159 [Piptocephalis cylindrospora]